MPQCVTKFLKKLGFLYDEVDPADIADGILQMYQALNCADPTIYMVRGPKEIQ